MSLRLFKLSPDNDTLLVNAFEEWSEVTAIKESSGVVSLGTDQRLNPTNQNRGIDLPSGIPVKFWVGPKVQLFVGSDALQTVSFIIQPLPFVLRIVSGLDVLAKALFAKPATGNDPYTTFVKNLKK